VCLNLINAGVFDTGHGMLHTGIVDEPVSTWLQPVYGYRSNSL
jgi:hypothetical protein